MVSLEKHLENQRTLIIQTLLKQVWNSFIINDIPCPTSFYLIQKSQENVFFSGYLVILVWTRLAGNTEI